MRQPYGALCLASALLAAGCARQEPAPAYTQPPPASAEPGPAGPAQVVAAPSPFGSRDVHSPPAREAVEIPRGTVVKVRLAETLDTARLRPGDRFTATLDVPILHGARVAVPKGTVFTGRVTASQPSGRLRGRAVLGLTLDSFELDGATHRVETSTVTRTSADHKRRNLGLIGGGSGVGAALGAIAGGAKGALIGAGAGAAAGTAGAAITGRRNVRLAAETPLAFSLRQPVAL